ncbi:hypothetical protein PR048_005570 [Dryococelus australis]|uniref:Uncharacterized protein n=1 Tax=Dryococelus australis TaxID=614101 RepID=A0ABQ9I9M4_9NEOP|nr:hypothetical protein PR048_005570 [Dryococelus australis]
MYRPYKEKCSIKYELYGKRHTQVFNNEFNLGSFTPTSVYFASNIIMPLMRKMCGWKGHNKRKQISRDLKRADVERALQNRQIRVCDLNLHSVLHTACCDLSVFYYKRRLKVHNFTIFDNALKKGYCYFWNEASGNKVAIEHASFVYEYIISTDCNNRSIILYSDNCSSQNKNKLLSYNVSVCPPLHLPTVIQEGRVHHTEIFSCRTYTECWGFDAFIYRTTKK